MTDDQRTRSIVVGTVSYDVLIVNDDDQFAATVPDCPGVFASGATCEEAEENIREAIRLYVEEMTDVERSI